MGRAVVGYLEKQTTGSLAPNANAQPWLEPLRVPDGHVNVDSRLCAESDEGVEHLSGRLCQPLDVYHVWPRDVEDVENWQAVDGGCGYRHGTPRGIRVRG